MESVLDDTNVLAVKTGMLYDKTIIQTVASTLRKYHQEKVLRLVCDPVCVSTSGHALLEESALGFLIDGILPLATLVTPNKAEAERILSHERKEVTISSVEDMISASKKLLTLGPKAVLVKGGHVTTTMAEVNELLVRDPGISVHKYGLLDENMNILQVQLSGEDLVSQIVVDVLQDSTNRPEGETSIFIRPRIESTSTHGTGCTLSAAIACGLASGLTSNRSICSFTIFETNGGLLSTGGSSGWDDLHALGDSSRFSCSNWPRPIEPHTLRGFEIRASVR